MRKSEAKKYFITYVRMAAALNIKPSTLSEWPDHLDGVRLMRVEKAIEEVKRKRREEAKTARMRKKFMQGLSPKKKVG